MAKLVYSQQSFKDLTKDTGIFSGEWESNTGQYYNSIVFTIDGYIITHGQAYKVINTTNTDDRPSLSADNGNLQLTFGNATSSAVDVLIGAEDGNYTTASVDNGKVKINHAKPDSGKNSLGASFSDYALTTKTATYDDYGHICSTSSGTATQVDYITDALTEASKKYYLLGGESFTANTTYYQPKKSTDVYITTDTNNKATFTTPNLVVSNGVASVTLGTESGKTTLGDYITTKIAEVSTAAMMFKGTINASDENAIASLGTVANGDTYKVATAGNKLSFKETSNGSATVHSLKVGDVLIANVSGTNVWWSVIPAGDETETFITTSNENITKSYNKQSGEVKLGDAALKAVANSVTENDPKLVTSGDVYSYIKGLGYSSGTVTGITPGAGLVNSQGKQDAITTTDTIKLNLNSYDKPNSTGGTSSLYWLSLDKDGKLVTDVPYTAVFGSASNSTTNVATSSAVYLNLLSNNRIASSLKLTSNDGISLSTDDSGNLTISNTYTSNVTSAFSVGEGDTIDGASSVKLTFEEGSSSTSWNIYGSGATTVQYDSDKKCIKIDGTNTWRPIYAYTVSKDGLKERLDNSATNTKVLQFGSEFAYEENDTNEQANMAEIHLAWAEIGSDGTITYSV